MVLHKYGDLLYKGLQDVVDEHLKGVADQVANSIDEYFLTELNKAWSDHKISMLMIRDILMYMVRTSIFSLVTFGFVQNFPLNSAFFFLMENRIVSMLHTTMC
jgi:hypothetical protein